MATLKSVKEKALRRLGVLAQGQQMSSDQDQVTQSAYNSLYARLLTKNIVAWGKSDDIPDAFVEPVVQMLAFDLTNEYGVSNDRWQRLQLAASTAPQELGSMIFPKYVSETEATDF